MSSLRYAVVALGALLIGSGTASADTYTSANFSGAISPGNGNVLPPFSGNGFNQSDPITGSLFSTISLFRQAAPAL